eukprot:CAMPEP_0178848268 /NCGR_PEP_ID=MMETSP0746-20121128/19211_1 /TAXON_ID=913974 /ORGANISM="Nitzschia punctata, Strain CCMP561" /LENGTH=41 /DNA_ID= /DNA_START= /DNA_END= /DNA_ORIENTATION=
MCLSPGLSGSSIILTVGRFAPPITSPVAESTMAKTSSPIEL